MVTAAATSILPPLIRHLKPGGRMVIPVGAPFALQYPTLVELDAERRATTRQLLPVAFVPSPASARACERTDWWIAAERWSAALVMGDQHGLAPPRGDRRRGVAHMDHERVAADRPIWRSGRDKCYRHPQPYRCRIAKT